MRKVLIALFGLALSGAVFASSQTPAGTPSLMPAGTPLQIGIVDVRQVLQKSPQVAEMQKKLQSEFGDRDKKIQAAQQQLQQDAEKLNRDGSVMAAADRNALMQKMQTEQQNVQAMRVSFQKDLYAKQNEEMQVVLNRLQGIIANIAKQKNLTLVVTKDAIAYANGSMDITNDVANVMDKR